MQGQRRVRWWLIAAIFFVPAFALGSAIFTARAVWTVRETYGQAAMQKRLDELEASGAPINDVAVELAYKERTFPDHTQRWLAVMEQLESEEFKQARTGVYNFDPLLDEVPFEASGDWSCDAATRAFVESHQPMLDEIRELCRYRQAVRFPYVFDSINTLLPYTQQVRDVARMLLTDGQIAIRDGDSARVREDIEAIFDCALVCSGEPYAISHLVCMALEFMAIDLLKTAIEHDRLALEDLERLLPKVLERTELKDRWRVMIEGERNMAIPCFVEPYRAGNESAALPARGWDCVIYLDLMDKALAIDTSSFDSLLAGAEQLEAELNHSQRNGGWLRTVDSLMTGLMAPAFNALAQAIVRNLTENRLAAHALAVAIYGKKHGDWPPDLSAVGLDQSALAPPGGKPFGYRIEPDGRACLWGFRLQAARSTPAEPPPLEGPAGPQEETRRSLWRLPAP